VWRAEGTAPHFSFWFKKELSVKLHSSIYFFFPSSSSSSFYSTLSSLFSSSLLVTFVKFRKPAITFVMLVCLFVRKKTIGSHWKEFHEMCFWLFFENMWRKFVFHWNPTGITGTSHEDLCTFKTISRWSLLRTWKILEKSSTENQNTFLYSTFFFFENCAVFEINYNNIIDPRRPQTITQYNACALYAEKLRLESHTQNMLYFLFFFTATIITRTRLNITL
jgi:hypothetical protein